MIEHTSHIGERVWDSHNCRWGYIALVGPFASDFDYFCPERNENCWESEVSH